MFLILTKPIKWYLCCVLKHSTLQRCLFCSSWSHAFRLCAHPDCYGNVTSNTNLQTFGAWIFSTFHLPVFNYIFSLTCGPNSYLCVSQGKYRNLYTNIEKNTPFCHEASGYVLMIQGGPLSGLKVGGPLLRYNLFQITKWSSELSHSEHFRNC
jgi:hypothetical protein